MQISTIIPQGISVTYKKDKLDLVESLKKTIVKQLVELPPDGIPANISDANISNLARTIAQIIISALDIAETDPARPKTKSPKVIK